MEPLSKTSTKVNYLVLQERMATKVRSSKYISLLFFLLAKLESQCDLKNHRKLYIFIVFSVAFAVVDLI